VAATALLPLVNLANTAAGVVSGLPEPVKQIGAALILLAGGAAVATAGIVAFNMALATTQVQSTISAVTDLARMLATNLAGAATVAIVGVQQLGTALRTLSTLSVAQAFGPLVAVLQTGVVTAATAAKNAVLALAAAINSGAIISGLQNMGAALLANNAALLKLGVAVAGVTALVQTWQFVLGGANEVSETFTASNKAISEALVVLGTDLEKTAAKAKESQAGFLGLGEIFRDAREGWSLLRLVDETEKMTEGFNDVYNEAQRFYLELKNGGQITEEQRKRAQEYLPKLQAIAESFRAQAEGAKASAVEQARLGNADQAKALESQARSLVSNANALDNLRVLTGAQVGVQVDLNEKTKTAAELAAAAADAIKARAEAEAELNKIIAEAPVRNLDAQLAVGQQLVGLSKALADQEQSRFAVVKAGLEFELSKAQALGASEGKIGAIKKQIQEQDRLALEARFQALTQQQHLEAKMLELAQQKARTEADLSVFEARKALLQAELEITKLKDDATAEERAKLEGIVELERAKLGMSQENVNLIAKTQPLERQSAAATAEVARNGLKTQAAQQGYAIAVDGSVAKINNLSSSVEDLARNTEKRKEAEKEIQKLAIAAPSRGADARLAVGGQLLALSSALAAEDQSRFDLARAAVQFELQQAEQRGASERDINAIKQRAKAIDDEAARSRFSALLRQQQLEAQMLKLNQEKAAFDAGAAVASQQIEALKAQKQLRDAIASGDQSSIAAAQAELNLQNQILGIEQAKAQQLGQTQAIERQAAAAQQNAAINTARAQSAQSGLNLAAARTAIDINAAAYAAGILFTAMQQSASVAATAASSVGQVGQALGQASTPAEDLQRAFQSTGDEAPDVVKGALQFAEGVGRAATLTKSITDLGLPGYFAAVASETAAAARAAETFYNWLERASRLPGARWSGGPVEAGEQYKINELGQEALLSNGRLSLINAAPNSLWRAPTNGTVIPAGITARLQEQGALPTKPGAGVIAANGSNAALAVEVGKLRQEVGELARKNWNVNVAMKTGPTGSQVLRQMMR
jgi:hypothetical protein